MSYLHNKKLRDNLGIKDSFDLLDESFTKTQLRKAKNDESLKLMNASSQEFKLWQRRASDARQWVILV